MMQIILEIVITVGFIVVCNDIRELREMLRKVNAHIKTLYETMDIYADIISDITENQKINAKAEFEKVMMELRSGKNGK